MLVNSTWLTLLLLFVGVYYLFLYVVALTSRDAEDRPPENNFYFVFVPAKNEEKVIERTLASFSGWKGDNYRVIVINDGSTDRTHEMVERAASVDKTIVFLDRRPDCAGASKGAVLNFALQQIRFFLDHNFLEPLNLDAGFREAYDDSHIIVGCFDADALVQKNTLDEVTRVFSSGDFDAVQTAVRIYNRDQSWLATMQDIEFLGFSRIIQKARMCFGSVGMGGNGQFARLSSLLQLGDEPWGRTLTEDLELGLRLICKGMRLGFVSNVITEQEGVTHIRPLFRQRTRWLQGHFTNWKYIPSVCRSRARLVTKVDTVFYLTFVTAVFLVALSATLSVLSILRLIQVRNSLLAVFYDRNYALGVIVLVLYSTMFLPLFMYSLSAFYSGTSRARRFLLAVLFAAYTYVWLPAGFTAIFRILKGETSWVKTERVSMVASPEFRDAVREGVQRRRTPRFPAREGILVNNTPSLLVDISEGGAGVLVRGVAIDTHSVCLTIPGSERNVTATVVWRASPGKGLQRLGLCFEGATS